MTLTTQDLFDRSVGGVIRQGGPSMKNGRCRYRGLSSRACSVGHLITDGEYSSEIEYYGFHCRQVGIAVEASIGRPVTESENAMIAKLQEAHDGFAARVNISFIIAFAAKARAIAAEYGLDPSIIDRARAGE